MTSFDDDGGSLGRKTFNGIWWSVELPTWWSGEGEDHCATFQAEPQLGALQISAARKDVGLVTDHDLIEFAAEQLSRGLRLVPATCGSFSGFFTECSMGGFYRKHWWVRTGQLTVYITYTVIEGKELLEKQIVESTLASLKPVLF